MKQFLLTLLLLVAMWIQICPPDKSIKSAWVLVDGRPEIALASILEYDYGFRWIVYRNTSFENYNQWGINATLQAAKNQVYFYLFGSRFI